MLKKLGFVETHRKGSHRFFYQAQTKKTATVPDHGAEEIAIGTLKNILRDIELDNNDFGKLRRKK